MSKNKEFIHSEIKTDQQIGISKQEVERIQSLGKVRILKNKNFGLYNRNKHR